MAGDPIEIRHTANNPNGWRTCSSAGTGSATPASRLGTSTIRVRLSGETDRQRSVDEVIVVDRVGRECVQNALPRSHTTAADFPVSSRAYRRHRARARCRPTQSENRHHDARLDAHLGLRRRWRSPHYRRISACLLRSDQPDALTFQFLRSVHTSTCCAAERPPRERARGGRGPPHHRSTVRAVP